MVRLLSAITFNFVIIVATLALIYFKIINVNIDTTLGLFKLGLFIAALGVFIAALKLSL